MMRSNSQAQNKGLAEARSFCEPLGIRSAPAVRRPSCGVSRRRAGSLERFEHAARDRVDRAEARDRAVLRSVGGAGGGKALIEPDERLGLVVIDLEALEDDLLAVVVALHEVLARHVILAGDLRGVVLRVVRAARGGVHAAARHALDDLGVRDADLEDEVDRHAGGAQGLGLGDRAGEAVEEGAVRAVGLGEALLDETDDDVVGHELALVHHGLGGEAERRAGLDGGAKHVARRNLRNAELLADELGLRALAGARRSDEDKTHLSGLLKNKKRARDRAVRSSRSADRHQGPARRPMKSIQTILPLRWKRLRRRAKAHRGSSTFSAAPARGRAPFERGSSAVRAGLRGDRAGGEAGGAGELLKMRSASPERAGDRQKGAERKMTEGFNPGRRRLVRAGVAAAGLLAAAGAAGGAVMSREDFGGRSAGERLAHMRASPNWADGAFRNLEPMVEPPSDRSQLTVMREFLLDDNPARKPAGEIPHVRTRLGGLSDDALVWLGHSGFFVRLSGVSVLIDPALNQAFPFPGFYEPFAGADVFRPEDLPAADVLLITHDHYDHLDCRTACFFADGDCAVTTSAATLSL